MNMTVTRTRLFRYSVAFIITKEDNEKAKKLFELLDNWCIYYGHTTLPVSYKSHFTEYTFYGTVGSKMDQSLDCICKILDIKYMSKTPGKLDNKIKSPSSIPSTAARFSRMRVWEKKARTYFSCLRKVVPENLGKSILPKTGVEWPVRIYCGDMAPAMAMLDIDYHVDMVTVFNTIAECLRMDPFEVGMLYDSDGREINYIKQLPRGKKADLYCSKVDKFEDVVYMTNGMIYSKSLKGNKTPVGNFEKRLNVQQEKRLNFEKQLLNVEERRLNVLKQREEQELNHLKQRYQVQLNFARQLQEGLLNFERQRIKLGRNQ
jgi:hypothetical protein